MLGRTGIYKTSYKSFSRDALVLGVSEKDAKEHFHAKLQESRKNSFHVSMNWFLHGLAKDNRQ